MVPWLVIAETKFTPGNYHQLLLDVDLSLIKPVSMQWSTHSAMMMVVRPVWWALHCPVSHLRRLHMNPKVMGIVSGPAIHHIPVVGKNSIHAMIFPVEGQWLSQSGNTRNSNPPTISLSYRSVGLSFYSWTILQFLDLIIFPIPTHSTCQN